MIMIPAKLKKRSRLLITSLALFLFIFLPVFIVLYLPKQTYAFFNFGKVLGNDVEDEDNVDRVEKDEDEHDSDGTKDEDEKDRDEGDDGNRDDDKDRERVKEVERTITYPSGGTTKIKKKMEGNKEEYEIKSYDAVGNKVEERVYKSEDNGNEKFKVKNFDTEGSLVSELKYRTNDGEEVRLTIKQQDQTRTKLRYDSEHNRVILSRKVEKDDSKDAVERAETEEEISFEVEEKEGTFKIKQDRHAANVRYPMAINEEGEVVVITPNKEVVLGAMPDDIVQKAIGEKGVDNIDEINVLTNELTDKLEYQITARKMKRILGLLEVNIPLLLKYDAGTGKFENSSQSFISSLLDLVSF